MPCRASSSSFRICETRFRPPSSGGAPMETVSVTSARRCVASACLFSAVDPPLRRIEAAAPRRCCPPSSEPIEPPLPRTSGGGGSSFARLLPSLFAGVCGGSFDSVVKCGFKAYSYVLEFLSLSPHALAIYCVLHDASTSEVRAAGTQPCRVQPLRDKGDLFPLPL
ncbi:hypothetical protein SASPL_140535 [Salvia splendens]|uniref:Uncharacterized protein n=1 Tax=Salvia splendens TaxID=180675 RepID=A0A8X8WSE1_SALSN|nr:hypothetical protein SASPL_140535 [Salvia splendens]